MMKIEAGQQYIIKHWFKDEKINHCSRFFDASDVVRETEKAVLVYLQTSFGREVQRWLPKAAVATREEYDAQVKAEVKRDEDRKAAGLARWQKYYDFAKANGVKGISSKMRIVTIKSKIRAAGIECPEF